MTQISSNERDLPTNTTPPPMHELLAKYEFGFYCDHCGEPAVELRPYWMTSFDGGWVVSMSCAEHSDGDRRIVEWLRCPVSNGVPSSWNAIADAIERGEHRG